MKQPLIALALISAFAGYSAAHAGEIDLTITGFADNTGAARIVLMKDESGYRGVEKPTLIAHAQIVDGVATWRADVPSGIYSIIAHHDMNADDALDRPLLGLPLEPYGYSNGAWTSFGLPAFEETAFRVGDGVARQRLRLRFNAFVSAGQVLLFGIPAFLAVFGALAITRRVKRARRFQQV